jgi:nitronate monooxygenase
MKQAGATANDYHLMQVWAGQSAAMAKPVAAGTFVTDMWECARQFL